MLRDLAQDVRTDEYNPKWIEDEPHTAVTDATTAAPEFGGGVNAYFQLIEAPFRTGIEGVVFTLKYADTMAELTEVVGKAEPGPGEFYVDYKEAGRKGTGRVEVNVADATKGFLASYYGVGAVGSVANLTTMIEEVATGVAETVAEAEVDAAVPVAVSAAFAPLFFPGRTTVHMRGRRTSASPSFPWHPYSETRTFTQSAAPDFFAALYDDYFEYALVGSYNITAAEHGTNYGSGVQLLTLDTGTAPLYLRDEFAYRAYDFDLKDTSWFSDNATRWWANFNPNISTEVLTFTEDADHRLQTGDPVVVVGGAQTNLLLGNIYYARRLTATTITLHPSASDAGTNSNIINLTSSSPDIQLDLISGRSEIVFGLASDAGHVLAGNYRIMGIPSGSQLIINGSVDTAGGAVSGSGRVYKFRVPGSTTTIKWHAEEDVALMSGRANGTGATASGIARLDRTQAHHHRYAYKTGARGTATATGSVDLISASPPDSGYLTDRVTEAISDGTNGTPRTGPRTRPRSVIVEPYVYVGENTLS